MLVLSGIGVIVIGFVLRFNPLLVVTVAALVTGWAAGLDALVCLDERVEVSLVLFFGDGRRRHLLPPCVRVVRDSLSRYAGKKW